jgi:hypothetical protein
MKTIIFTGFLLGAIVLFSGCASTSITSFTDPDYRATQFNNILVAVNTNKLSYRLSMENRIVEVFTSNGIKSIPSYSIFPPTREFTDSVKKGLMIESKIDGCLMVYFGESGIEQVQIPVIGSTTKGSVTNNSIGANFKSLTTYIGGQVIDKPYAEFDIKLFDAVNGKMAWIANSYTGGSAYSNFNTVYSSFCDKIIDRLSKDNLIRSLKDIERIKKEEVTKRDSTLKRILKEREEKADQNKIDVIVKHNGDIISGTILGIYFIHDTNYVKIQETDSAFQRIKLEEIKEVYQR